MLRHRLLFGLRLIFWGALVFAWTAHSAPVDFNRDIRPILSEHCFACHGPDEAQRKAGLRLNDQASAFNELKSGVRAIVAGKPSESELVKRVLTSDEDDLMPPHKFGKPLSDPQKNLLKDWVAQGANWQKHWSFNPPQLPKLPIVKQKSWILNPIDRFVLARLEKEGLKPNPPAEKTALIRRATFDLTGLPPTVKEVDAFLADGSSDAYEKVVDRLLESPHYGERMAQQWLDLARFADTSGYHFDGVRFMWLWRDWVINAYNNNKPYDEFTIEQLAGDLLPNATRDQKIATGFVRNNMTTDEGGADPDEYLNKYAVDRVNTLGTAFLGLTIGCTECHDHKYDPISTKEFYQLYAFFNQVPEKGLDRIRTDNPPPRLAVPTAEQAIQFVEADFALKDAEKTLLDRSNELGETQEKWERLTLAEGEVKSKAVPTLRIPFDEQLEVGKLTTTNSPVFGNGRFGKGILLDGKSHVEVTNEVTFSRTNEFSYGAWVKFEGKAGCILSKMDSAPGHRGVDLLLQDSRFEVHIVSKWAENAIKVRTRETFTEKQFYHVLATYDGSGKAEGVKIYVDGRSCDLEIQQNKLNGEIASDQPLRIGSRPGEFGFKGVIDDVRFYTNALTSEDARILALEGYWTVVKKSRGNRSSEERSDLARFYKQNYAVDYIRSEKALAAAKKRKDEFYKTIPSSMIMEDMKPGKDTFVLVRGDFRTKGEKVSASTPSFLPPLPPGQTNRLALARWVVSRENPLAARVAVNRYWALFFGNGLVKTANDFGAQGEWPSHPELLDWLAVQFRDGGKFTQRVGRRNRTVEVTRWDRKALIRLIVTSATYRQSAAVGPYKLEKDPYNRLLARGPRLRLDAENIRDNALAVSGLLNKKIGGPSVKPYQPPGIWDGVDAVYKQDKGDLLYRRGMYVFWRRSAHYPSFATFDAPNREVCTAMRQRTQTPLQSLVLMNDPAFVEAARALAARVTSEEPEDLEKRITLAFRHTLGRKPARVEIKLLKQTYSSQLEAFNADADSAKALLKVGESKIPEDADMPQLAALTTVANILLNLNEAITK